MGVGRLIQLLEEQLRRMFVAITNTPQRYAWGSRTGIADLLGR